MTKWSRKSDINDAMIKKNQRIKESKINDLLVKRNQMLITQQAKEININDLSDQKQ